MKNILTLNSSKCVSCRSCELACSLVKTDECNPKNSRIKVITFDEEGFYSPTFCFQCNEAWCAKSCPVSAIVRDEKTDAFVVDEEKCVGCRMCTLVCPFGQIFISKTKGKASKCDLCDGDPACIKFCPTQAIKYEKTDSFQEELRKKMAKKIMIALQSETS
jgi:Fe-S-cluster-containing hydrogenase component 2